MSAAREKLHTFKIVHLSDLHVTGRDRDARYEMSLPHLRLMGMNDNLKTLLASNYVQDADHILITGDVTDRGEMAAWNKFDQILKRANVHDKTSFVVGNHDICELGTFKFLHTKKKRYEQVKRVRTNLKNRLARIGHACSPSELVGQFRGIA